MISELWGSLFNDDLEFEAKNKQDAIKQYLKKKGFENVKVVYDSINNRVYSSARVIAVQEGWYEKEKNTTHIQGNRGFYKIVSI